jgi:hypothetical protein
MGFASVSESLNEKKSILLISPPYACFTHPQLSLPCLTAFLRAHGIPTRQMDLNLDCVYFLLSAEYSEELMKGGEEEPRKQ